MKTKPLTLLMVCWALLLQGCLSQHEVSPTPTEEGTKTTITARALMVINTPTPAALKECWGPDWQLVWGARKGDGELQSMREGPQDAFWFLTHFSLAKISTKEKVYKAYDFRQILHCDNCQNIINGTLAISTSGDAWVGLSTGLLIIDKDGASRQISTDKILPSADKSSGLRVLLSDTSGRIWVSNANNLCFFDGSTWKCHQIDGLKEKYELNGVSHNETAEILSAVSGQGNQVWFGTQYGRVILFNGEEFEVYHLNELAHSPVFSTDIGSLAFDEKTSTLWAVNTRGGYHDNAIGVFKRASDGNWQTFEKDLFFSSKSDASFYGPLTAITIAQDGIVWLGMERKLALVYYDGLNWRTIDGNRLPIELDVQPEWRLSNVIGCDLPDDLVRDVLSTNDGHLLVGNQIFGVMYQRP